MWSFPKWLVILWEVTSRSSTTWFRCTTTIQSRCRVGSTLRRIRRVMTSFDFTKIVETARVFDSTLARRSVSMISAISRWELIPLFLVSRFLRVSIVSLSMLIAQRITPRWVSIHVNASILCFFSQRIPSAGITVVSAFPHTHLQGTEAHLSRSKPSLVSHHRSKHLEQGDSKQISGAIHFQCRSV